MNKEVNGIQALENKPFLLYVSRVLMLHGISLADSTMQMVKEKNVLHRIQCYSVYTNPTFLSSQQLPREIRILPSDIFCRGLLVL